MTLHSSNVLDLLMMQNNQSYESKYIQHSGMYASLRSKYRPVEVIGSGTGVNSKGGRVKTNFKR